MKKATLDSITLRWILIGAIVLFVGGSVAGTWYMQTLLENQMAETNRIKAEDENSSQSLAQAQALKIYLENNKADTEKTAKIVAETTTFKYQDQIIQDITRYASAAGLTVLGFNFNQSTGAAAKSTNGLNSISAVVTLQNPVPYNRYLTFLKLIEQNLTKMQITDITITPEKSNPNLINNPTVTLEVYSK